MASKSKKNIKRKARYGMVKIAKGQKLSWLSVENKQGWSLGLALNGKTIWLKNTRFPSQAEAERAVDAKVVFIPVKGE
jgi:uncharacterized protein YgiM (DUF1202 family)